ncbi:MAG TPA: hypothetical protein VET48_05930 [Steroidobacteraceae bacterium]|nr:hypothetical protein [Steroidobacteraceae bacterium]
MNTTSNAWESFLSAAQLLSSRGPIKQRLTAAYTTYLANVDVEDIPRECREEFVSIGSRLSVVVPLRGETAVQASIRKMSDFEAAAQALRIVNLMGTMMRMQLQPRQPVLRAVNSGDD